MRVHSNSAWGNKMCASVGVFVNVESSASLIWKIINPKCSKMKKILSMNTWNHKKKMPHLTSCDVLQSKYRYTKVLYKVTFRLCIEVYIKYKWVLCLDLSSIWDLSLCVWSLNLLYKGLSIYLSSIYPSYINIYLSIICLCFFYMYVYICFLINIYICLWSWLQRVGVEPDSPRTLKRKLCPSYMY